MPAARKLLRRQWAEDLPCKGWLWIECHVLPSDITNRGLCGTLPVHRRRDPGVEARDPHRQGRGDCEGADGAEEELGPGGGLYRAERYDKQQQGKVQEVGEIGVSHSASSVMTMLESWTLAHDETTMWKRNFRSVVEGCR